MSAAANSAVCALAAVARRASPPAIAIARREHAASRASLTERVERERRVGDGFAHHRTATGGASRVSTFEARPRLPRVTDNAPRRVRASRSPHAAAHFH